jgi:hypothetical protein
MPVAHTGNVHFYTKRQAVITTHAVGADTVLFAPSTNVFEAIVQPKGQVRRDGHTFFSPFHITVE